MMEMYSAVLSGAKAKTFVDQIFARLAPWQKLSLINPFKRFDSDKSGEIDFKVILSLQFHILESFSRWVRSIPSCNSLTDSCETKVKWPPFQPGQFFAGFIFSCCRSSCWQPTWQSLEAPKKNSAGLSRCTTRMVPVRFLENIKHTKSKYNSQERWMWMRWLKLSAICTRWRESQR